jgi:hypothetical protein
MEVEDEIDENQVSESILDEIIKLDEEDSTSGSSGSSGDESYHPPDDEDEIDGDLEGFYDPVENTQSLKDFFYKRVNKNQARIKL